MNLSVYTYTNKGSREMNEDKLDYFCDGDRGVFVLADGLGGHNNSSVASEMAVNAILSAMKAADTQDAETMREILCSANALILDKQKEPDSKDIKTTAVVLDIRENRALWGHVGDSRLYYFTNNEIGAITKDHSVSYKKYLGGEITYRDINTDDDRSSLLGVLGNREKCMPEISGEALELKDGDMFLLCSDGFWEYVYDEEMLIDYLKSKSPREWVEYMLLRHIRRTKPTNDNFSLIAVYVQ